MTTVHQDRDSEFLDYYKQWHQIATTSNPREASELLMWAPPFRSTLARLLRPGAPGGSARSAPPTVHRRPSCSSTSTTKAESEKPKRESEKLNAKQQRLSSMRKMYGLGPSTHHSLDAVPDSDNVVVTARPGIEPRPGILAAHGKGLSHSQHSAARFSLAKALPDTADRRRSKPLGPGGRVGICVEPCMASIGEQQSLSRASADRFVESGGWSYDRCDVSSARLCASITDRLPHTPTDFNASLDEAEVEGLLSWTKDLPDH